MNNASNKISNKQTTSFKFWSILAICALVGTVALAIFILAEALVPGDKSGLQSFIVTDTIKDNVDIKDNDEYVKLASISAQQTSERYIGYTEKIKITFFPDSATDKELIYKSSNPQCISVSSNGTLSYKANGNATITITSKKHPEIQTSFIAYCNGENPNKINSVTINFDKDSSTPSLSLKAGESKEVVFRDGNKILSVNSFNITSTDTSVLRIKNRVFLPIKAGTTTLKIAHKLSDFKTEITFTVEENPDFALPETFEFAQDTIYMDVGDKLDYIPLIVASYPKKSNVDCRFFDVSIQDKSIIEDNGFDQFVGKKIGQTTVNLTSWTNPKQTSSFTIIVQEPVPTTIFLEGNNRIVSGESYQYKGFFGKEYLQCIKWQVVKGDATIDQNGTLVAHSLGTVIVRVTSTRDESVYTDLKIKVSLFSNFHTFVRKVIGHFSAFAVLGFGLAVTFFLLQRPRGLYFLSASVLGFLTATLSEVFQLPIFTQHRGASWTDVMTDTLGVLTGVVIASIAIAITLLVQRIFFKNSFERTERSLNCLRGKTLIKSLRRVNILTDMTEYRLKNQR